MTTTRLRNIFRLAILVVGSLVSVISASAQLTAEFEKGFVPYQAYDGSGLESVNVSNGNLVVHIPIVSYPQRGTLPELRISLVYNNKGWVTVCPGGVSCTWTWNGGGVDLTQEPFLGLTAISKQFSIPQSGCGPHITCPPEIVTYYAYVVQDPTGASHEMGRLSSSTTSYASIDASGLHATTTSIVDSNGVTYSGGILNPNGGGYVATVTDPAGNSIVKNSAGTAWTDSIGRTIPTTPVTEAAYAPGCTTVSYPGPSGGTSPVTYCFTTTTITSDFGEAGVSEGSTTRALLTSVTLPNGTSWSFAYNSWGDLAGITLPTGGSISYSWSTCYLSAYERCVTARTVNPVPSDPSQAKTWTYTLPTRSAPYTVTATDPLGNYSVHSFTAVGTETQVQYYDAGHNLLKTVATQYFGGATSPFSYITGSPNPTNLVPEVVTTTWPNGMVAKTCTIFDYNTNTACASGQDQFSASSPKFYDQNQSPNTTYAFIYGRQAYEYAYDYGQGAAGPLLRETFSQYLWQSSSLDYSRFC